MQPRNRLRPCHCPLSIATLRNAALGLVLAWATPAVAANNTVPGAITTYTTVECVGFEWTITGDDNDNCVVSVEYRPTAIPTWSPAQPLWRVENGLWTRGQDPGNMLAGSVFFLAPGTAYQARLTLSDPDGGTDQRIVSFTTRTEPRPNALGRRRFVIPGSGGGSGTLTDPFRGLAAADAAAQPGDIFIVQAGLYTTKFTPTRDGTATNPIVYWGTNPTVTILDGQGGASGGSHCVDLTNRRYVFIENMTLRNCLRPMNVAGSTGVLIRGCAIQTLNVHGSYAVIGDNAIDLFVSDNEVRGWGQWEQVGRTGEYAYGGYGIHVTGHGIVMCYNHIVEAWDALDAGESDGTGPHTYNVDIYNNFVERAADDATQTDAVWQNIRIFRNRFLNSGCATSGQPAYGGPVYVLYNEMCNTRIDPFKMHQDTFYFPPEAQETSGMICYHNTNIGSKAGWYESGYWHHMKLRNNLLLGGRPNQYTLYIPSGQRGDLDYDGYNRQQTNLIKYNGPAYATLPAFYSGAGQEQHGLEVTFNEFVRAFAPVHSEWDYSQGYGAPYGPSDMDLHLRSGSVAIDRGQVLPNINDGFAGAAPDLGCYEYGGVTPWYGPRPNLSLDVPEVPGGEPEGLLSLAPPAPNPSSGSVRLAIDAPRGAVVAAQVVDLGGRLVRTLATSQRMPGGVQSLTWDGRDEHGQRVAAGVYYLQVRSDGRTLTRKVAMLP